MNSFDRNKVVLTQSLIEQFLQMPGINDLIDSEDLKILQTFLSTQSNLPEAIRVARRIEKILQEKLKPSAA